MREFRARSTFWLKGRGAVIVVDMPQDLWEPNDLQGTEVCIDGVAYYVKAVESFCIARSPQYPYCLDLGLVVTPQGPYAGSKEG